MVDHHPGMQPRTPVPASLQAFIHAQDWAVTRALCHAHGLSDEVVERLLKTHLWQPVVAGIHIAHNGPASWSTRAWAAVLQAGRMAMLCDRSAAALWGLVPASDPPITVLVPHGVRPTPHQWWGYRRTRNWPTRSIGQPPRTPLAETIIDMCQLSPDDSCRPVVEGLRLRRATRQSILAVLDSRPRVRNRALLEAVLGRVSAGICSELEHRCRGRPWTAVGGTPGPDRARGRGCAL